MDWRMIMRRCPSRSMTLVGDVAQTSAPGGASSWEQMLEPYVADRWRLTELTVNYRTPTEIMDVAAGVLAEFAPGLKPPTSVRETGVEPWALELAGQDVYARLPELVVEELAEAGDGTVAVLCPEALVDGVRDVVLAERASVLTVPRAKGLEFDSVIVLDPAGIIGASPRGHADLYVALTRATQRLGIVHTDAVLDDAGAVGDVRPRQGTG